jgi:hypothetical protein
MWGSQGARREPPSFAWDAAPCTTRRAFVIRGKHDTYMAIIQDRVIFSVGFLDLVKRLCDQKIFKTIPGQKREGRLEKVESLERWKFIQHSSTRWRREASLRFCVKRRTI